MLSDIHEGALAAKAGTPPKTPAWLFKEKATFELAFAYGFSVFNTIMNDDQVIAKKGKGTLAFYDTMVDSDGTLSGLIDTRIAAVAGLDWEVVPASDDEADQEMAAFVRFALDGIGDFDHVLEQMLGACRSGFSVTEVVWEETRWEGADRVVPAYMFAVKPTRFRFDTDYNLRLLTKSEVQEGEKVDPYKFLVHTFGERYRSPYGVSILRACYWAWWFKHNGLKYWLQAAERGAVVTPVGFYPEGSGDTEIAALKEALKTFLGNKYISAVEGTTVTFPQIKIAPEFAEKLKDAMNEEMRYRILGGTLSSGTAGSGSRAIAEVHERRLQERVESDAKQLMATVATLVRWIVDLNFLGVEGYPRWVQHYEAPRDMKQVRETVKAAVEMGVPVAVKDVAEMLGVPLATEGEDLAEIKRAGPQAQFGNPEDEEEEGADEEDEGEDELEEEGALRPGRSAKGARRRPFGLSAASGRARAQRARMKRLVDAAERKGKAVIESIRARAFNWVGQWDSVEDALLHVGGFEPDVGPLALLLRDARFLAVLYGFHDVHEEVEARGQAGARGLIAGIVAGVMRRLQVATYEPVAPERAIEMFEARDVLARDEFDLLEAQARRRALTAANMTRETIQGQLRDGLTRALRDGVALPAFHDGVRDIVMSPAHAENIFRTNIMGAYNDGHAEAMWHEDVAKAIPAFSFMAIVDDRTTDMCMERDGQVYTRADMEAQAIIPPLHFMCRSTIVEVFADEWDGKVSPPPAIPPLQGFGRWRPALPPRPAVPAVPAPGAPRIPITDDARAMLPQFGRDMQDDALRFRESINRSIVAGRRPRESAALYSRAGERLGANYKGDPTSCRIDFGPARRRTRCVISHSHPNKQSFSGQDIMILMRSPEIDTMVVIGRDNVFVARRIGDAVVDVEASKIGRAIHARIRRQWGLVREDSNMLAETVDDAIKASAGEERGWYTYAKLPKEDFGIGI